MRRILEKVSASEIRVAPAVRTSENYTGYSCFQEVSDGFTPQIDLHDSKYEPRTPGHRPMRDACADSSPGGGGGCYPLQRQSKLPDCMQPVHSRFTHVTAAR